MCHQFYNKLSILHVYKHNINKHNNNNGYLGCITLSAYKSYILTAKNQTHTCPPNPPPPPPLCISGQWDWRKRVLERKKERKNLKQNDCKHSKTRSKHKKVQMNPNAVCKISGKSTLSSRKTTVGYWKEKGFQRKSEDVKEQTEVRSRTEIAAGSRHTLNFRCSQSHWHRCVLRSMRQNQI